ncbi:MAG: bifunctional UDP-N-acetylglucosamine diphosphorylase/glucosamine-1-phosphate N-acetyltransferase GlmU [Burkholderiaceae bacterium]
MNIVVLAAGMGKRMRSSVPKVLHPLAGQALLGHVLEVARSLSPSRLIVVYGHGGQQVPEAFSALSEITWARQDLQLGTGHAVAQTIDHLDSSPQTLILSGDVPLTRPSTLKRLLAAAEGSDMALLTVELANPTGYGRILRENGRITGIVEEKDATPAQRALSEVYSGILVAPTDALKRWLGMLANNNAQAEYYLTDVIGFAAKEGLDIGSAHPDEAWETLGVNSKSQLAQLERIYQGEVARGLLEAGVTLADPARLDVRGRLECGNDVFIDVGCVFEGHVVLADGVHVGAHCVLSNARVGADAKIEPLCHIDQAVIGERAHIGPYARLRPGTELAEDVHIGNFVEVKNSQIAAASKANHLSYVGDTTVGQRVNIGAGTITCNYDGANKHRTVIGDDVHIGSDTQLVAPVHVGPGATVGAGTTVWKDVPAGALALNEKVQIARMGWTRPKKHKKPA